VPPELALELASPLVELSESASFASLLIASDSCWGLPPLTLLSCWPFLKIMKVGGLLLHQLLILRAVSGSQSTL
jgi:hypothetical protein